MKRVLAILRWLGVKRVIASAVLGVVFPLLFAAWVASGPKLARGLTYLDHSEYFMTSDAVGLKRWSATGRQQSVFYFGRADESALKQLKTVLSEDYKIGLEDVPLEMPKPLTQWHRSIHGWPACALVRTIFIPPDGPWTSTRSVAVPNGWWSGFIGTRTIPIGIVPSGLALNWLFYAPLFYLLFSVVPGVRHVRRKRRGLCLRCGYDLSGLASCPECGADRKERS